MLVWVTTAHSGHSVEGEQTQHISQSSMSANRSGSQPARGNCVRAPRSVREDVGCCPEQKQSTHRRRTELQLTLQWWSLSYHPFTFFLSSPQHLHKTGNFLPWHLLNTDQLFCSRKTQSCIFAGCKRKENTHYISNTEYSDLGATNP